MSTDEEIKQRADAFARAHKKHIAHVRTDPKKFPPDTHPVAVFMSGSPGAGKTEASLRLIEKFSLTGGDILRIDTDDLRASLPGYTGTNSSLFQSATSIIADKMQDYAIKQHQSYIFDGTLAYESRARSNITRCLKHGYSVYVIYVYQDPIQAWSFVQARARNDGRYVPKAVFINLYFKARECVQGLKLEFGDNIEVNILIKNVDGTDFRYITNTPVIDTYVPEAYTRDMLETLIT